MKTIYKNSKGVVARREVLMALAKVPQANVCSSYRTEAEQQILLNNGKTQTLYSNHRRGLAVDCPNWQAVEKQLNDVGLVNDIEWDKNHFAWGGESQAAQYPILDNPRILPFFPNPVKVKFILSGKVDKEKIIKQICKVCSFYSERGFDLDWTLETLDKSLPFYSEWSGMRWIDWSYLMSYAETGAITCWIYDAGKEQGLINNTGKFKDCAIVQIPMTDFLLDYKLFPEFYGDYPAGVMIHEFCHALNWLLTSDLQKDQLDAIVSKRPTDEEKIEAVGEEVEKLFLIYVEKRWLPIIRAAIEGLRRKIFGR